MNCPFCDEVMTDGFCFDCEYYEDDNEYLGLLDHEADMREAVAYCDCEDYPCCGH